MFTDIPHGSWMVHLGLLLLDQSAASARPSTDFVLTFWRPRRSLQHHRHPPLTLSISADAEILSLGTKIWYEGPEMAMMNKNTSVSLGAHFTAFIEGQVEQGRYRNASDVMRAGLRLLEEQEARLAALRAALVEGEQSGLSTPFDFEAFIARKRGSQTPAA